MENGILKKAKAEYKIRGNASRPEFIVWFEAYDPKAKFFGFFTTYTYDSAYSQIDERCKASGYRLETFTRG